MRVPFFRATGEDISVIKDSDQGNLQNQGVTPLAAGGILTKDLDVSGYSTLWIYGEIGNATTPATAATDAVIYALPYKADGVTTAGNAPAADTDTTYLQSSKSLRWRRYNVSGFTKIQVNILNQNVAALQGAYLDYFLQR